jgi:CDGSH-type Zn-finger protein
VVCVRPEQVAAILRRLTQALRFTPVKQEATESKKVWLCACKHTADQPTRGGTHKSV